MASLTLLAIGATLICALHINLVDGKTYQIMKTKANWFKAYQECRLIYDKLASMDSETEQRVLVAQIEKDNDAKDVDKFWIALTNLAKEQSHRWFITGKGPTYLHWADNMPDNKDGDCVLMDKAKGYMWSDSNCLDEHHFICETPLHYKKTK